MEDLTQAFKAYYSSINNCCLIDPNDLLKDVVECVSFEPSEPDGESGAAVCKLTNNTWVVFEEWQDYSGHFSCQCGAQVSGPFTSQREAELMGLGDGTRKVLGISE